LTSAIEALLDLRSQFATSNKGRGGRRYAAYGFTEYRNHAHLCPAAADAGVE
jgi:hypothetical protein